MPKQEVMTAEAPANLPSTETSEMVRVIREVAMAPDAKDKVEVIRAMLDMQRQLTQDQAERALNVALTELAKELPHVKKNGKIPLPSKDGGRSDVSFAKWEDIDTILRPLLAKHGLSLSFTSLPRNVDGGGAIMTGRVSHVQGAFREAQIALPLDSGPGRNNLQAMGSTISYGKKYLAFMLLNIVTEGEDNDGATPATVTEEQAAGIEKRAKAMGAEYATEFMKWAKVEQFTDIPAKNLKAVLAALTTAENHRKAPK